VNSRTQQAERGSVSHSRHVNRGKRPRKGEAVPREAVRERREKRKSTGPNAENEIHRENLVKEEEKIPCRIQQCRSRAGRCSVCSRREQKI